MASPAAILEATTPAGELLQLAFHWRVDRFHHTLVRVEEGVATMLLESMEGSELDRWPPSPPLQQLSLERLPDGRQVALLVGMAGSSHWSLTAETEPGAAALVLDVACRIHDEGAVVGSAYRAAVRYERIENAVALHRPGGQGQPALMELLNVPSSMDATPHLTVDGRGPLIRFNETLTPGQTVRWKYRFSIP